MRKSVLLLW